MTEADLALIAEWQSLIAEALQSTGLYDQQQADKHLMVWSAQHAPALLAALKDADRESCMWRKNLENAQSDNAANADALMLALKDAERVREALDAIELATNDPDVHHGDDSFEKAWRVICDVHQLAAAALAPPPVEPPAGETP